MPQSEKDKIIDQLWRLVRPGEFIALQDEKVLTLSVSGECREESLHRVELLCAAIKAMQSPSNCTAIAGDCCPQSPCKSQGDCGFEVRLPEKKGGEE